MSILEKALGKINPGGEKDKVQVKINCDKDNKPVFSYAADYKVLYPQQAIEDNVVLSVGGTIVNFPLEKNFFDIFSEKEKKEYNAKINKLVESIKSSNYLFASSNQNGFESFSLFHKNIKMSLNRYLVDLEEIELENIPGIGINSLVVSEESIDGTVSITNQEEAFNYVSENIEALSPFVNFKFIPFEIISEIANYISSKLDRGNFKYKYSRDIYLSEECSVIRVINEFQNGGVSEEELVEFVKELGYSKILGSNSSQIIEQSVHRFISFLFPLHKLSVDDLFQGEVPDSPLGYYTIITNKIILKTPDISFQNSSQGYDNVYNFNAKENKLQDIYLFFSLVDSQGSAKPFLSKINIAPLPMLGITGYFVVPRDSDGQISFKFGILQDGLVGGSNEKLGIPDSIFSDYKIILSPLSERTTPVSETDDRSLKTSVPVQLNKFEYFTFPNLFLDYINVNDFIDISSEKALKEAGVKNPSNKLGLNSLEGFFSESFLDKTPNELTKHNGLISYNSLPEVFSSEFNLFGELSRPEIYFTSDNDDSDSTYSQLWFDLRLSENSSSSSSLTQSSRPNFFDTTPVNENHLEVIELVLFEDQYRDIPNACIYLDLKDRAKTLETDRRLGDYEVIDIPVGLKELRAKYNLDRSAKFSAYIVDKYGQWSKASFSGSSEVTFQIPNPEIKSITPDGLGDNPELFIRENDQISFELKGLYLELVDTIRFVDSEGVDLIQNLQSLDNLSINVTPSSVSLSSTSLFQDFLPSGQEIFVFVQNSSIGGDPLVSNKVKIYINQTESPSPPKETPNNFYPGKITPLMSGIKGFYDIPLIGHNNSSANSKIYFKSTSNDFDSELYIYLATPIINGVQDEAFIRDILSDFSVSKDILKVDKIASTYVVDGISSVDNNLRYSEIPSSNLSNYIINKRVVFDIAISFLGSGYEGFIEFPGIYNNYNMSRLKHLKECSFLILNKKIEEVIGESNFGDFSKLKDPNIYSIVRIGNNKLSHKAFINPPFISNIVIQKNGKFHANSILRTDVEKRLLERAAKKVKGLSGKISDIAGGETLISAKKVDFISVIFEAPTFLNQLSDYKILVEGQQEESNFLKRLILGSKYKIVYRDILHDKAIIVIKDFKSSETGFLNISVEATSKTFNNKINSTYFKKITVSSSNIKRGVGKESFLTVDGALTYQGEDSIFVNYSDFTEDGDVPDNLLFLDQKFLPIAKDRSKTNDFITLTNYVEIYPFQDISIGGVLSESSENANSSSLIPNGESFSKLEERVRIYTTVEDEEGRKIYLNRNVLLLREAVIDYIAFRPKDFSEKFSLNRQETPSENSDEDIQKDLKKVLEQTDFLTNLDPLSPISSIIGDLTSASSEIVSEKIYNKFVAILPEISQFLKGKTKFWDDQYIEDDIEYKMFLGTYILNTSIIGFGVPAITKIETTDGTFTSGNFEDVKIKEGQKLTLTVENYDESFALSVNGIKQRISSSISVIGDSAKIELVFDKESVENLSTANNIQKSVNKEDPCGNISLDSTNPNYNLAENSLSSDYLAGQANGFYAEIGVVEEEAKPLGDFKKDFLKFVDDSIDRGRTAELAINSFCDFSFSLTTELKGQLKGFKKVLTVIKVIFCIVDVICALLNPVKLGFAVVRLFNCLFDLVLLLPQLSVPVMLLSLCIHILKLVECVFGKTVYYVNAVNQIITAIDFAVKAKNYAAIKNLEEVLRKYGINFKRELDVMSPIQDIIDIFNDILGFIANFPCQVDEDDGFCIDSSLVAGIISSQLSQNGSLSYDKLLPMAQDYTTLDPEDALCGNTPESSVDIPSTEFGGRNCGFGNIFKQVDEAIESGNIKVAQLDLINPSAELDIDPNNNRTFGFDFDATFTISATKMINFGQTSILSFGGFFGPAGITSKQAFNPLTSFIFKKKYISLSETSDSRPAFLNFSNPEVFINTSSNPVEDGFGFVSFKDGFKDFLSGSSSQGYSIRPLRIEYTTLSGQTLSVTYDTVPSVVIMDEQFNMYYVKDKGIKVADGKIKEIQMRPVSNKNVANKNYQTEQQTIEVDETVLTEQSNWDYLNSIVPTTSAYRVSGILQTLETYDYAILLSSGEISSEEYNQIELGFRSYDYVGSSNTDDNLAFQNAIETIDILSFPKFYIVDMRQFSDLLSEACSATGFNDIIGVMEIDEDDVAEIVKDTEICTDEYVDFLNSKFDQLLKDLENGDIPEPMSIQEFEDSSKLYEECIGGIIDRLCKFVVNPLNSSFLLTKDTLENEMEGIENPTEIEPEVLAEATGLETPDITGASEYATGIGVEASYIVNTEAEIQIILRDSYDDILEYDFSDKIKINIIGDATGSAEVVKFNGNDVYLQGNSYFARIKSSNPGRVEITASVCSKTIKAFTFEGLELQTQEPAPNTNEGCVEDAETVTQTQTNKAPLGSLVRIDRVLSIIFEASSFSESVSETNRNRIITSPQEFGTKVVN